MTGTAARGRSHLGDRTAAFVDGQLSGREALSATRHLDRCQACAAAVRAQRLLKWRMSALAAAPVAPPAALLGRLTELGDRLGESVPDPTWPSVTATPVAPRRTVRRAAPRAVLVGGLSVLAVAGAYAVSPGRAPTSPPASNPAPSPAQVSASVPAVASVPALPGTGILRTRAVGAGSAVLRAALAVEPARSTAARGASATVAPAGRPRTGR